VEPPPTRSRIVAIGTCETGACCRYRARGTDAMLTISIIFALLVLLWGRVGVARVDR
jgi:hypothetical protein